MSTSKKKGCILMKKNLLYILISFLAATTFNISFLIDIQAVENSLQTKLANVQTIGDLNNIVTNADFNKTEFQGANGGTAIYTKIHNDFYITRNASTLDALATLLSNTKGKNFLSGSEINNIGINLVNQVASDIALRNRLTTALNEVKDIASLNTVVSTPEFNYSYIQGEGGGTNVYNKIKDFYDNKTPSTFTEVKDLLDAAKNKNFLSSVEKANIETWLTPVNSEVPQANVALNTLKSELATILNDSNLTPKSLNEKVVSLDRFNITELQGANGGDALYNKLKDFYDNKTEAGKTNADYLTNLEVLLKTAKDKKILSSAQNNVVIMLTENVSLEIQLNNDISTLNSTSATDKLKTITKLLTNSVTTARLFRTRRSALRALITAAFTPKPQIQIEAIDKSTQPQIQIEAIDKSTQPQIQTETIDTSTQNTNTQTLHREVETPVLHRETQVTVVEELTPWQKFINFLKKK